MQTVRISLVFLFSLLARLWLAPRLDFGVDQQGIYQIGKTFYETGIIPAEGPRLVYTGESIPGGFQAIMAGIPLFFSQGEAIGLQLWVGFLNWLSMLLLFFWLRTRVKSEQQTMLAFFLGFAPWSLLFSPAWNPSFLPVFAVLFFWILDRTLSGVQKIREYFLLGLIGILCLQLHLSAVLLGIAVLISLPLIRDWKRLILNASGGVLLGSVFLLPWIQAKWNGSANAPTGVVGLHLENIADIPKAFFRYFTFPTAEVSRFLTPQGHGFQGMITMLQDTPLLWIPAVIALSGSLWMVWKSLQRWGSLRSSGNLFSRVEFLMPILMTVTFLFSIKGASAHTFWILMPLSFYSMVESLKVREQGWKAWLYLTSAVVFSLFGYLRIYSSV